MCALQKIFARNQNLQKISSVIWLSDAHLSITPVPSCFVQKTAGDALVVHRTLPVPSNAL